MPSLHSLLKRQLKRYLGRTDQVPPEIASFIEAVNGAYHEFDRDRSMLERSLELSSQELMQATSDVRAVLQAFPDLFFWLDEHDLIVDCKAGDAEDLYPAMSNLVNKYIQAIPVPEVAAKFAEAVRRVRREKRLVSMEYSLSLKGEQRFYEARLLPLVGGKIMVIVRNITERKQAEEALGESEERYRTFVDSTTDLAFLKDDQLRYIVVNKANQGFFGRPEAEVLGKTDLDLMPREAGEACMRSDRQALEQNGIVLSYEHVGEKTFECRKFPVQLRGGKRGVGAFIRDITQQRQAEEALRESEERFRGFIDTAPDVIYTLSADAKVTSLSPIFEKVTGWRREDWLGKPFAGLIHEEDLPLAVERFQAALGGQIPHPYQLRVLSRSGEYLVGEFTTTPLVEKGVVVGGLGIARDITERKRAEEALRRSEEQLRQSQKMEAVGRLAGGIAHDFNNLLTSILGFGRLVLDRVSDPATRADVEEIMRSGERAARLTGQLLAFSRKQVLRIARLDLNRVVSDMERLLQRTLGENISLVTILGDNLGSVEMDRGQLDQVVMNLAINARDAMPSGGTLTIETSKASVYPEESRIMGLRPGDYAVLVVKDTGYGMTPDIREHAFEPFFTSKKEGRGTGLGLPTVYGIVQQCGGWIDLISSPEKGTEVRVLLPRVDAPPDGTDQVLETEVRRGTETILLVEDEEAVRTLASRMLSSLGYKVLEARNGVDAFRMSQEFRGPVHLVLTDVIMPMMGGPELVQRLRESRDGFRVLYATGFTEKTVFAPDTPDMDRQVILKPYTREALAQQVRRMLDQA